MYVVHLLPFICSIINFSLTDIVFLPHHGNYLLYFASTYGCINFLATKYQGTPLYSFLPWDDFNSLFVATGLSVGAMLVFRLIAFATEYLKNRTAQEEGKVHSH
mmetsp:Transcript_41077/g.30213  ORF Transcript_41077/g.30213 Transcript_41077/m.30213 type:complete len:104 (-) Transcript_41077:43-354(-)